MIINNKWLQKYIDYSYSDEKLCDKLTYLGLEADLKENPLKDIDNIVIGEIREVREHPDADKLRIAIVFDGERERKIVSGAPNLYPDAKVPLALPGCELPGGTVSKVELRGVKSEGMIPAEDELGISDDHSGIIILPDEAEPGNNYSKYYQEKYGVNFDIDLTPNRPDCTSHIGVARDLSVLTEEKFHTPEIDFKENGPDISTINSVNIHTPDNCPRYATRVIKDIKIKESPEWLQRHLKSVGLRPINNIVDAANFVLMETGQPLHTFDLDRIAGNEINVRLSNQGEEVVTLDGESRKLNDRTLLICDAEKPIAIAGIMGLQNSEVTEETTNLLLESAYFDPATIRKGSKYLDLNTDASYRFERGIDPQNVIYGLDRVTDIITEIAGGTVCKGRIDNYPNKIIQPKITVRFNKINSLLGEKFDKDWITKKFKLLGCDIIAREDNKIKVQSPSWRPDLKREVDYIEEIVRIKGMEKIKSASSITISTDYHQNKRHNFTQKVRKKLSGYGYNEVYNNSLTHADHIKYNINKVEAIKIDNPLSQKLAYLRTNLISGLTQTAKYNINHGNTNLQLFEIGNVHQFAPKKENKSIQKEHLSLLLTGNLEDIYWKYSEPRESSIYDLKGLVEQLIEFYTSKSPAFNLIEEDIDSFENLLEISLEETVLGHLGKIATDIQENELNVEQPLYFFEGNMKNLFENTTDKIDYQPISDYPAVERDISIIVNYHTHVGEVIEIIQNNGGSFLKDIQFYDKYSDEQMEENNKKSLTFNLIFQSRERTLKDSEVDQKMDNIFNQLQSKINAELR